MQRMFARGATIGLLFLCVGCAAGPNVSSVEPRLVRSFDSDWRFLKGDVSGGEKVSFDDSGWMRMDVPHDWSIAGPVDQHNSAGGAGAFLPTGVGWYRKHFTVPDGRDDRQVRIEFDGVMANSDVWVNGFHLGHRPNGYVGFEYELSGHFNFGGENVVAVRTDTSKQPASRWYAGSGIYRHVRLVVTSPVHFQEYGTFVTTPVIGADVATVHVRSTVLNQSAKAMDAKVRVTLIDPNFKRLSDNVESSVRTIAAGGEELVDQDLVVKPELWSVDHPAMYCAICELVVDGKAIDRQLNDFGIRTAEFRPDTGFWLNGQNLKIKGVCLHGDMGGLGVAVPVAAWEHRLTALKELGVNAIRTAHNPPSPEFLDLCDRMGFLVMDEMFDCWTVAKNPYDYHLYFKDWSLIDARDTVRRDRNHPCVILYSAGNEIHDTPKSAIAIPILNSLVQTLHKEDPTRPVTQALFRPNVSHDYDDGLADLLDVVGTNYRDSELLAAHAAKRSRKILGTENGPALQAWLAVRDHPEYAGQFIWTGADYLGESRHWPTIVHDSGLVDVTDEPRGIGYERESWWTSEPMVRIVRDEGVVSTGSLPGEPQTRARQFADWSPKNSSPHPERVLVFSNCEQVELFLNGKSLGEKDRPADDSPRSWRVGFEAGELKAIAKNKGAIAARDVLRTAGESKRIHLSVDRDQLVDCWDDVAFVTVTIEDQSGTINPAAGDLVTFKIVGPGKIVAVESADTANHEPFVGDQRHAYQGRCVVIIRATGVGEITVEATAPSLTMGSVKLKATPSPDDLSKTVLK